jgi:elongator complex protein 2
MNFVECDNGDLLLASSAQDKRIRLWRVASVKEDAQPSKLDPVELLNKMKIAEDGTLQMGQYAHLIKISDSEKFSILLESVMLGHEEWVFGATWAPAELVDGSSRPYLFRLAWIC